MARGTGTVRTNRSHRLKHRVSVSVRLVVATASLAATTGFAEPSKAEKNAAKPAFPLRISQNHRHLEDAAGRPFLYHADTPWGLFVRATIEDARRYMDHRKAAGFNTLQVQLLPEGSITPGTNIYGQDAFLVHGDYATPNEAYFAHVEAVLDAASKRGLLMSLNPVWLGCCDGGRRFEMETNGVAKCRELGRYLGNRFKRFPNVIWINGGDMDPGRWRPFVNAVAEGLKETAPGQMHTAHWSSTHSSRDEIRDERWLDINATYTYAAEHLGAWRRQYHVYHSSRLDYLRQPPMPFFLIESTYENEHRGTPLKIRRQAWWSVLSGSCGQAVGIGGMWGLRNDWTNRLDSPAVRDMGRLRTILEAARWWTLEPDLDHRVLTAGYGTYNSTDQPGGDDYVTASVAKDGSLLLAYVPAGNAVTVDTTRLKGRLKGFWIDPTNGRRSGEIAIGTGLTTQPPGPNATGDRDWVLLVESKK